ncbi:MAG: SPOR domain-containing protein [Pseudomonadota bacterium]|nr:SPOR domain-containing protein [Pseudomonadota bacterium]
MKRARSSYFRREDNNDDNTGKLSWFLFGVISGLCLSLVLILCVSADFSKTFLKNSQVNVTLDKLYNYFTTKDAAAKKKDPIRLTFISGEKRANSENNYNNHLKPANKYSNVSSKKVITSNHNIPHSAFSHNAKSITNHSNLENELREKKALTSLSAKSSNAYSAQIARNGYFLKVAVLDNEDDAESLKAKLLLKGYSANTQKVSTNGKSSYRVVIGPYETIKDAYLSANELKTDNLVTVLLKS